jgi:hypothetical protein
VAVWPPAGLEDVINQGLVDVPTAAVIAHLAIAARLGHKTGAGLACGPDSAPSILRVGHLLKDESTISILVDRNPDRLHSLL